MASDYFSQPGEAATEPLGREEGRRLGESQELLDRMVPLLGHEQEKGQHGRPEPGAVPEEELQHQEGEEVEVRQEGGLRLQGEGPGGCDEERASAEEEEVSTQELQWRLARLRASSPDATKRAEDQEVLEVRPGHGERVQNVGPGELEEGPGV